MTDSWDRRTIFKYTLASLFWLAFIILFLPFYSELLLAGVFALAIEPFLGRLLQKRQMKWRTSVALILSAMFVVLAVPVTIVIYKLYVAVAEITKTGFQNTEAFKKMAAMKTEVVRLANSFLERFGLTDRLDLSGLGDESLNSAVNAVLHFLTAVFYNIPGILLSIFVFCAALYFFLAEAAPLKRIFQRQRVLTPAEAQRLIHVLQRSSYNTVVSSMIIAAIQATIVSVGALIIRLGDFTVIWVVTFFCSFVPVIGAGPVALVLAASQLVMGDYGQAIWLLVVAIVAGTMDNIIRPYLIASGEEDLHPVVSLLAIIGALIVFGMPGLFLGPVIAAVTVKIIPTLMNEPEPAVTASGKDPVRTKT